MAATAATTTALSITEVLESILVVCRPYDVLHAQRVCSYWRTLIQTSKTLQRKLFLAPSGYDEGMMACPTLRPPLWKHAD